MKLFVRASFPAKALTAHITSRCPSWHQLGLGGNIQHVVSPVLQRMHKGACRFCHIVLLLLTGVIVPSGHEMASAKGSNDIDLRNVPTAAARELGQYFLHLVHLGLPVTCPLLLLFIRGSLAFHRAEQLILCSTNQQLLSNNTKTLMRHSCGFLNSWD